MKHDDGSNRWNNQVNKNDEFFMDGIEGCDLVDDDMEYEENIDISSDIKDVPIEDEENLDKKDDIEKDRDVLNELTYTQEETVLDNDLEQNNQQEENEELSSINEISQNEKIEETLDPKIEAIKQQQLWEKEMYDTTDTKEEKKDLSEFPIEKKQEEDSSLEAEKEENKDETEVYEPVISPEIAVDADKIDKEVIKKPRNYKELISTNGEVLENYISGNSKFNNMSENFGVCIELCKLFIEVNSLGYHFNGVSAGDIVVTPEKTCKLINADKLVSEDDDYEINYTKTCAPEILRKEAKPNQYTDKYSLAFILFGLLFKSDPFEGKQMLESVYYTEEDELKYYQNPVFVYNNRDKSNEPIHGIHSVLIKYWNRYYSGKIKMAFMQSFVDGIENPEARVEEDSFIEIFKELKYIVDSKDSKDTKSKITGNEGKIKPPVDESKIKSENTQTQQQSIEPKANYQLCIKTYYMYEVQATVEVIDLVPGLELPNSIVGYDEIPKEKIIGKVIQNAKHKDIIGIKNLSNHKWIAAIGGNSKEFEPGKVVVVKNGVEIDFYPENKSESKSKWSIR